MKFKNPRIVDQEKIEKYSGNYILSTFRHYRGQQGESWFNPTQISERMYQRLCEFREKDIETEEMTFAVIDYAIPEMHDDIIDRNDASKLLNSLGFRNPSTLETLQIACYTMISSRLSQIMKKNGLRDIVAATPFHPEDPTYFAFRLRTNEDTHLRQEFIRSSHFVGRDNELYFFNIIRSWPTEVERRICFPLLLGIK